jgi:hypothetical protein
VPAAAAAHSANRLYRFSIRKTLLYACDGQCIHRNSTRPAGDDTQELSAERPDALHSQLINYTLNPDASAGSQFEWI